MAIICKCRLFSLRFNSGACSSPRNESFSVSLSLPSPFRRDRSPISPSITRPTFPPKEFLAAPAAVTSSAAMPMCQMVNGRVNNADPSGVNSRGLAKMFLFFLFFFFFLFPFLFLPQILTRPTREANHGYRRGTSDPLSESGNESTSTDTVTVRKSLCKRKPRIREEKTHSRCRLGLEK